MSDDLEYGQYPFKLSLHKYDLKGYKQLLKKMGESTVGTKPELYMRLKNRMESDWDEKVKQDEEIGYAKQMGLPIPTFVKPTPPKKERKPRAKKIVKDLDIEDRTFMTLAMLKEHAKKYGLAVSGTKAVLIARIDEYLRDHTPVDDYDPESATEPALEPVLKDKNERDSLSKMTVSKLKELAKSNGLPVSGTKPILITRIIEFLNKDVPDMPKQTAPKQTTPKPIPKPVVPIFVQPIEESIPTNTKKKPIIIKRVAPLEEDIPSTEPVNKGISINRPKPKPVIESTYLQWAVSKQKQLWLQDFCIENNLPTGGSKDNLVMRVFDFFNKFPSSIPSFIIELSREIKNKVEARKQLPPEPPAPEPPAPEAKPPTLTRHDLENMTTPMLKNLCKQINITIRGSRERIIGRIIAFLPSVTKPVVMPQEEPATKPKTTKRKTTKPKAAPYVMPKPSSPIGDPFAGLTLSEISERIEHQKALESISARVDESKLSPDEHTLRKLRIFSYEHGLPITGSKKDLIKRINKLVNTPSGKGIGKGILDTLKSASQAISNFGTTLIKGRSDYPQDQKTILSQFGNMIVRHIQIGRTPLPSLLTQALNIATLGAFSKALKRSPYDKLYHLFVILTLDNNKTMLVEKNEAINMKINPQAAPKTTTYFDVAQIPSTLTFSTLMANTQRALGSKFFSYDSTKNNCQDFIIAMFKSNSILTQPIYNFVKQDVGTLFQNFENTKKLMNVVTDLGSKFDIIKKGGRLNKTPVLKEYSKLTNHLISHVTDPSEPVDPRDYTHSIDLIKRIQKIKGSGIVQSVIFRKPQWTEDSAIKWLDKHSYKHYKIDEEPHTIRFRQHDPLNHMKYRTKSLGKSGVLLNIEYDKLKSPSKSIRMPPKKIYMSGSGLEGNAGIGGGMGCGLGAGMECDSDSGYESSDDDEGEGSGLYVGGRGLGAGIQHLHVHVHHPEGGKINWKKVGNTVWKVAKPIVKDVSHKYLPKLGEEAGLALGTAAATLSGNPEMAPVAASFGSKLGKAAGKAADKQVQGLGIGAGVRKGRFEKGSKEAMEWAEKMRQARQAKKTI